MEKTALVAGASGLIGRRIAERLIASGDWRVAGLARRAQRSDAMRWIAVDLADPQECSQKLAGMAEVTHVFYAARYDHPEGSPESVEVNAAMLRNLLDAVEGHGNLRHVHALQGSKYYGHQLGPVALPMVEEGPRAPGANFYFEQQEFLRSRSHGKQWTYTLSRPHAFCDPAIDHPRSIGLVIAVLALVQRELGLALDFPASAMAYESRTQFTDLGLLARAIVWMAQEARCAGQAFNVVNGDNPRWSELWPRFARWFGMPSGEPRDISLVRYMADKAPVWDEIVKRHRLLPTRLDSVALWAYGDYQFAPRWDVCSSMAKARLLGFIERVDSCEMFSRQFEHYRAMRLIP